jgi:DNA-binding transcriptional regulator GbsR (MarR family)
LDMARSPEAIPRAQLLEVQDRFIAAWGQMGAAWGVSRTMAEVYALLYITGEPLNTDDVMDRLRISRGNASMSLRSLVEWGLVGRAHKRGDRKEYFLAEQDPWSLSRKVMRERLRREVLPLLTTLHELRDSTSKERPARASRGELQPGLRLTSDTDTAAPKPAGSDKPVTAAEVRQLNDRIDALLELVQTIERLGERFVGSEGKGLKIAATMLSKII